MVPVSYTHLDVYKRQHLPSANLGKQFFLLHLGLGFVDKSNLLGGHSLGDELLADVLIDGKGLSLIHICLLRAAPPSPFERRISFCGYASDGRL